MLAVLALVVALPVSAAHAAPRARTICVPVRATGVGQDLGEGRTQATISIHGLVVGRTNASFTINQVVGTTASFTGPIVFTNALGTLTAPVAGTFDLATGAFHATSTSITGSASITGSGLLRGVSGTVTLDGVEDFANLSFTETISGRLCRGSRR